MLVLAMASALLALVAPDAGAGTLYVTNRGSGDLAILDAASLTVRKVIPVGEGAWGVAVAPETKTACVSYAAGLAIVNLEAGGVHQRVVLGGQGMGVAMSKDGALCYVAVNRSGGDRLVAVERAGARVRGQVPIGERAFGVYLSPDEKALYVPGHDAFALSVIEAASLTKRRTIPLKPLGEGAFDKPHYLAMSPDGATLYLANNVFGGEGSLSEIDTRTFQELRRIPLGKEHEQVTLNPVDRRVYLTGGFALGGHDELTVVDLASGAVTRVGTGGRRPFAIVRVP